MTIREAINRIDNLKHNVYSRSEKIAWLARLDAEVKQQIIDAHENNKRLIFAGYDEDTPEDTELLIPFPYDDVYLKYLEAQIDYYNGEYDKYNNAIVMYQAALDVFTNYYRRTHMPKGTAIKYF